ncbi:MAG: hypothetical protein ACREVV_17370 [Steroidobacteraceae bacterium]
MTRELEFVRIPVASGRSRELVRAIEAARDGYLALPACTRVELMISDGGDEVAAIITWTSARAHANALKDPRAAQFFEIIATFAIAAPEVRKYLPADYVA